MTKWYQEWASVVKARKGRMLPIEAFKTILKYPDPGYCSAYSFSEEDAQKLIAQESSIGMNKMAVGSSVIIIDIDTGDEGLSIIGRKLSEANLRFQVWESGGKGYHIIISQKEFIYDKRLPYSQLKVVESLVGGDGLKHVDTTLYQHGRLISLPGRIHPTTKKKKRLIFQREGERVDVPLLEEPPKYIPNFSIDNDYDHLSSGLFRLLDLVRDPPETGKRHIRLWGVASNLARSGLDYTTVLTLLQKVNESWKNPKKIEEVEQAVRGAFKGQI